MKRFFSVSCIFSKKLYIFLFDMFCLRVQHWCNLLFRFFSSSICISYILQLKRCQSRSSHVPSNIAPLIFDFFATSDNKTQATRVSVLDDRKLNSIFHRTAYFNRSRIHRLPAQRFRFADKSKPWLEFVVLWEIDSWVNRVHSRANKVSEKT